MHNASAVYTGGVKMLRTIIVARHAKAKRGPAYPNDFKRPLSSRGKADAMSMGSSLKKQYLVPELVISSAAKRAKKTAKRVMTEMAYQGKLVLDEDLYLSGSKAYLKKLRVLDDEITRVMLVGHNPDLEDLVYKLTGEDVMIPTAGIVCIDLNLNHWKKIKNVKGKITEYLGRMGE